MQRIYGAELKKRQIEILDFVADFCDKNNIKYWIDCGTLIGAVRHKGYIPWDDDIDIGMLRPDFEKFTVLFNKTNEKYKFYCIDNNSKFYYAHGKVLDTDTVLYEPDKSGVKLSINIDVKVYDNVPNKKECERMYKKRNIYRVFHILRVFQKTKPRGNIIRRAAVHMGRICVWLFPEDFFIKKISMNAKKHSDEESNYVGDFTSFSRLFCEKDVFSDFITAEFEGKEYKIPIGYDKWLRAFYGDYMQLPPENKRVTHHRFEAYIKD